LINLMNYGWNEYFEKEWDIIKEDQFFPGRITADFGLNLKIICEAGEFLAQKHLRDEYESAQIAVGDWVGLEEVEGLDTLRIRNIIKRKTKFSRASAGLQIKEQIVAANVDYVFLVQSMNRDFNIKRLERYLICGWESGAVPVIILTKADGCENVEDYVKRAEEAAPGVEVYAVSSVEGTGLEDLSKFVLPGKTVALLGSSGVGKSTLLNALAKSEIMKTGEIREKDGRGRHTSTHRELFLLGEGGLFLDTPGMRTLSIWEGDEGISEVFGDIEDLVESCKFKNCTHGNEPGCAVRAALETGSLPENRWERYQKLQKEMLFMDSKKNDSLRRDLKSKWKQINKQQKQIKKHKG